MLILAFLEFFLVIAKFVEIAAVTALVLIAIDYAFFENRQSKGRHVRKATVRREKEESASGYFVELPFKAGFDTTGRLLYRGEHRFPTAQAEKYHKQMDEAQADVIFKSVEEL
jgi:hypothetical protein